MKFKTVSFYPAGQFDTGVVVVQGVCGNLFVHVRGEDHFPGHDLLSWCNNVEFDDILIGGAKKGDGWIVFTLSGQIRPVPNLTIRRASNPAFLL